MGFEERTRFGIWRSGRHAIKGRSAGALARAAGRVVLWVLIAVVLVRGLGAIVSGAQSVPVADPDRAGRAGFPDAEARVFAARFATAYLDSRGGELAGFFAEGLSDRATPMVSRRSPGARVTWATVAREQALGASRALITVATSFQNGQTRYLAVPVARDQSGGLVVDGLPSFAPPPARGSSGPVEPVPLAGTEAAEVSDLVERFVRRYVAGDDAAALRYFLAPGTSVAPMPDGQRVVAVESIEQIDDSSGGAGRLVLASVRVRDRATGTEYPLAYRVRVARRERWYVTEVQGGPKR